MYCKRFQTRIPETARRLPQAGEGAQDEDLVTQGRGIEEGAVHKGVVGWFQPSRAESHPPVALTASTDLALLAEMHQTNSDPEGSSGGNPKPQPHTRCPYFKRKT